MEETTTQPRGITINCTNNDALLESAKARIMEYLNPKASENNMTLEIDRKAVGNYFNPLSDGKYRNASCLCGSGKKIKKCHGKERLIFKHEHNEVVELINTYNNNLKEMANKNGN